MKIVDVKDNTYIDSSKEVNDKDTKFKVGDHVRISEYKSIFAKGYIPNWPEEDFIIKKVKNTVSWTYIINNLNLEEKKTRKKQELRIEKVIKKKGDILYIKWKVYDSSFNSWIDKKRLNQISIIPW